MIAKATNRAVVRKLTRASGVRLVVNDIHGAILTSRVAAQACYLRVNGVRGEQHGGGYPKDERDGSLHDDVSLTRKEEALGLVRGERLGRGMNRVRRDNWEFV